MIEKSSPECVELEARRPEVYFRLSVRYLLRYSNVILSAAGVREYETCGPEPVDGVRCCLKALNCYFVQLK